MSYNKLKSLVANVEAIATAMKIRIDDRQATDEEKDVLSRYSGFGGIKDVLNIGTEYTVSDDVAEPIRKLQDLIGAYPYYDDASRHQQYKILRPDCFLHTEIPRGRSNPADTRYTQG